MISKEELLKQETKKEIDMKKLEKSIDKNLKNIRPDTITDREVMIKVIDENYSDYIIQRVLDMYKQEGGYNNITFKKGKFNFDSCRSLDIIFEL